MVNIFQGTKEHPYHVSVGAVVLNHENKVLCHYFGDQLKKENQQYPSKFR